MAQKPPEPTIWIRTPDGRVGEVTQTQFDHVYAGDGTIVIPNPTAAKAAPAAPAAAPAPKVEAPKEADEK